MMDMLNNQKNIKTVIEKNIYIYRYDFFAIMLMVIGIVVYVDLLWTPGQIVFSDIDFPFNSKGYLNEIIGLWNNRWNTTSMLNIPRLFVVLPTYLLSFLLNFRGSMFLKAFIYQLLMMSAFSTYLLSKRLVSVYTSREFDLPKILSLIYGSLFYALNPYVIFRIQHIYLLVGYSLFPLVLLYFFKVFDHKFLHQIIPAYSPYSGKVYPENYRDGFILAYLLTIASAAIHYFFYSVMALGIIFILLLVKYSLLYRHRNLKKVLLAMIKKLLWIGICFIGFSFFWLSIYIGSIIVGASASQHNINVIDTFTMFSRNSSWHEVLYLISYWWRMIPDATYNLGFYVGGGILIGIIIFGVVYYGFRHHIILLVSLLAGIMFLLATGVNYPVVSSIFLKLCNLPFFGNVFRDPNKLVGLLALCYAILLIFGLEAVVLLFRKKRGGILLDIILFAVVTVGLIAYLWPMKTAFVDKYYAPITEPAAYEALREYYAGSNKKVVYLPVAEQMLRPIHSVATPKWNTKTSDDKTKATGDVHIYNTPVETVFHHEGNDPMVTYYINYLQWLMDQGRTEYFSNYISAFGMEHLVYHDEYIDHEERQDFNKEILNLQNDFPLVYNNDIFSVYQQEHQMTNVPTRRIWTPYGLHKLEAYQRLDGYRPLEVPTVFINQQETSLTEGILPGDQLEVVEDLDIYLSSIDKQYKVFPFEWVQELNPFLKWSKTYLKNSDWAWYMQQLGNIHKNFDLDQGHGVVVTFASGKLNIQPHLRKNYQGALIMDFDTMLRTDTFFQAETPSIYDVQANPIKDLNEVGVVNGVLSKGDPKDIWQVAKSALIRADENTPYSYNILISGRHTNKLHVKVRFYDKNREEIGVQYVTAPNESVDFEAINFTGEAVSPKTTYFMRIDLLAFQRPEVKTYWWIHDINIYDYSAYKTENVIEGDLIIPEKDTYDLYVRSYQSPKSGIVEIMTSDEVFTLNNRRAISGFNWSLVGVQDFEEGESTVAIKNIEGFNAINQLVFVPHSKKETLFYPITKAMKEATQLITLEGEMDFNYQGNIQSRQFNPSMSYGTGLSLQKGTLSRRIDILETGYYKLTPSLYFPFAEKGKSTMTIKVADGSTVYTKRLMRDVGTPSYWKNQVHYVPLDDGYIYDLKTGNPSKYYPNLALNQPVLLHKGDYTLSFDIDSEADNLATIEAFDKFDSSTLLVSNVLASPYDQTCSPCESISMDMFRHRLVNDMLRIDYDATCSCDWYIYSSPRIDVVPLEELRVSYEARSEYIKNRHGKLIFVDAYDHIVDTAFIFEVEESEKAKWHRYEQLVTVPEGAEQVLLQFWTRGDQKEAGYLELKDISLERYSDYITLDTLVIEEVPQTADNVDVARLAGQQVTIEDKKRMTFVAVNSNGTPVVWNSMLSPTPLWRLNGQLYDYALNGITMGYNLKEEQNTLSVVLGNVYYAGVWMHLLTFVFGGLWIRNRYRRRQYEKSINR